MDQISILRSPCFFSFVINQKGLNYLITNDIPDEIKFLQTDRNKLESIISNLIKNAIKFTHSGTIEFSCSLRGDSLLFTVRDTGVGIPSEQMEKVFDRFVQADMSGSRPHEGSGLGLSIVKAYVEMLGGEICVESQPGKGSTFTFTIPYFPADDPNYMKNSSAEDGTISDDRATILIAEDDYASYLYLEKLLSRKGVIFLHTTNGPDTVKTVWENPDISLLLLDIRMPGMTGIEAAGKIREFNSEIPIIAQTAYSLAGDRELALEAGCNEYISKPIGRTELMKLVSRLARKQII